MQRGKLNFTMYVSPFGVTLENFDKMECLDAAVLTGTARLQNEGRYYGPPTGMVCFKGSLGGTKSVVRQTDVTEKTRKQSDVNL